MIDNNSTQCVYLCIPKDKKVNNQGFPAFFYV